MVCAAVVMHNRMQIYKRLSIDDDNAGHDEDILVLVSTQQTFYHTSFYDINLIFEKKRSHSLCIYILKFNVETRGPFY